MRALVLVALLAGCSGGSSGGSRSTPPPPQLEFAGTWIGSYVQQGPPPETFMVELELASIAPEVVTGAIRVVSATGAETVESIEGDAVGSPGASHSLTLRTLGGVRLDGLYLPATATQPATLAFEVYDPTARWIGRGLLERP